MSSTQWTLSQRRKQERQKETGAPSWMKIHKNHLTLGVFFKLSLSSPTKLLAFLLLLKLHFSVFPQLTRVGDTARVVVHCNRQCSLDTFLSNNMATEFIEKLARGERREQSRRFREVIWLFSLRQLLLLELHLVLHSLVVSHEVLQKLFSSI